MVSDPHENPGTDVLGMTQDTDRERIELIKACLVRFIETAAAYALHGGDPLIAIEKGGPGSGHFGHAGRPGSRGGSATRGGGAVAPERTQLGITSHRPGRTPAQAAQGIKEWRAALQKTPAKNVKVQMGIGGYKGGREPSFVTTYEGDGKALKAAARFGRDHGQEAVVAWKFATRGTPGAEPIDQLSFRTQLNTRQMRAVEKAMLAEDIGGWTWSKSAGGHTRLQMAYMPDWSGYSRAAHTEKVGRVLAHVTAAGISSGSRRDWATTTIMYGPDGYDAIIGTD